MRPNRPTGPRAYNRVNAARRTATRSGPPGAHLHADCNRDHRPPRDRHDPDALHRWRPAGKLGPPRRPDGRGADGLHALDPLPATRPEPPVLARPRPVRAERRPRVDAPLFAPPSDRLRRLA